VHPKVLNLVEWDGLVLRGPLIRWLVALRVRPERTNLNLCVLWGWWWQDRGQERVSWLACSPQGTTERTNRHLRQQARGGGNGWEGGRLTALSTLFGLTTQRLAQPLNPPLTAVTKMTKREGLKTPTAAVSGFRFPAADTDLAAGHGAHWVHNHCQEGLLRSTAEHSMFSSSGFLGAQFGRILR
jgi:hypothetical protein